jgi:hypothetical protein
MSNVPVNPQRVRGLHPAACYTGRTTKAGPRKAGLCLVLRNLYVTFPERLCAARLADPSLPVTPTTPDPNISPTFKHSPDKPLEEFQHAVDDFLTKCRPRMQELVSNAGDLPSFFPTWKPKPGTDEGLARHISTLCIPAVSDEQPSLLLHGLGEENDIDKSRIQTVFSLSTHTYVTWNSVNFSHPITSSFQSSY